MKLEDKVEGSLETFRIFPIPKPEDLLQTVGLENLNPLHLSGYSDEAHAAGSELYCIAAIGYHQLGDEFSPNYLDICLPGFADELILNSAGSMVRRWRQDPDHIARIDFSLEYKDGKLRVSIGDNGVGLPDDIEKETLAESSYSTKDPEKDIGGRGQGLFGIQEYFQGNEGNWGFTRKKEGVVFWYELPVDQEVME
jgi:hypothetical protein